MVDAFDEKKFLVDDEPTSASELIEAASRLNESYANDWCKATSRAAQILREHGHVVKDKPAEAQP